MIWVQGRGDGRLDLKKCAYLWKNPGYAPVNTLSLTNFSNFFLFCLTKVKEQTRWKINILTFLGLCSSWQLKLSGSNNINSIYLH